MPLIEPLSAKIVAACALVASLLTGCSDALFTLANAPTHFSSVRAQTDIAYGDQPRQRLDIYAPPQAKGLPVVIFWYGGAWTDGTKDNYRFVGTALAESGLVAILPDYRLYPAATFPVFLEDGARAVAWVERHAENFGGDHTRIVLMGHSAGAHEAAMLTLAPTYLAAAGANAADIVGLIGLSGPYVLEPDTDVLRTIFSSPYGRSDWQPVRYANPQAPPTLLLHGLEDQRVLPLQTRRFRDALAAHGVSVEMDLYDGASHADTIAAFSVFEQKRAPELARVIGFIRNVARAKARSGT
jgi:acetyl esterase/lipase